MTNKNYFEQAMVINNTSKGILRLVIEPWAEEVSVAPGKKVGVLGRSIQENPQFELQYEDGFLVVYARTGAMVSIDLDGDVLKTASRMIDAI